MGDNTEFDLNDLPEEVVNEIVTGEVFTIEEETQATTEESSVVEEPVAKAPKSAKKVEQKLPGMYHEGKRIDKVTANLGKKWTVIVEGRKQKVLKANIEIIK